MNKVLSLCLLLCLGIPARAVIYVVDRADDAEVSACSSAPGDCTLRGAINRANASSGADTISFAHNVGNVVLTEMLPTITDTAGLAINGEGGIRTEIRGTGGAYRIFNIARSGALALSDVTLTKGNSSNFGGAIYNAGTLSLSACQISDNTAARGGGIYNAGGAVTVQSCTFWFNNASEGGAIFNATVNDNMGTVTASDTAFTGNIAAAGGAIRNSATLTMRRCSLDFNKATASPNDAIFGGGGIFNDGTFTLESSTSYHNGSNSYGGGVLNRGALTVSSCTFSQDGSPNGGAVAYAGDSTTFGNTIFDAAGIGNVVKLPDTSGSFFSEGFNISSDATGPNSSFDRTNTNPKLSKYFITSPGRAGYVPIDRDSPAADSGHTTISPDVAGQSRPYDLLTVPNAVDSNGADVGAYEIPNARPLFSRRTYNVRLGSPTQIQLQASDVDEQPLTFKINPDTPLPPGLSLSSSGQITGTLNGEIMAYSDVKVTVEDNAGGSSSADITLIVTEPGSLVVNTTGADNDFDGKTTLREAVAFARTDGTDTPVTFDEAVFAAPRKTIAVVGGKIDLFDGELVTVQGPDAGVEVRGDGRSELFFVGAGGGLAVRGLTLTGGRSTRGGGILSYGDLSVDGCTFIGNRADGEGGAIYAEFIFGGKRASIVNSTFSGNSAGGEGGAIYNASYGIELDSLTIVGNSAQLNGGGIGARNGSGQETRVTNSIIVGNTAGGLSNDVQTADFGPTSFQSGGFNRVGVGNATGAFAASGDSIGNDATGIAPLAENGGPTPTRALLPGSVAIDRGKTSLAVDQRGIARPQGSAADQGAFEVVPVIVNVRLLPDAPRTNDILRATVSTNAPNGGDVFSVFYEWQKNGVTIPGETNSTLNLAKSGNGDKGDIITVVVSVRGADGSRGMGTKSVTVANSAPIAISSQGFVDVNTEKAFPLLAFDADGDTLRFQRVGGPKNGIQAEIRVDTDGKTKLFYKSRPKYGGVDVVRFVAFDSDNKQSNESTLGITVLYTPPPPVNRAPVAGDTNIDTYVNSSVVKGLLGSDPDGDALTFRIVNNAKYGTSEIKRDKDGLFKLFYTSLNRFYGPDRVTYVVTDSRGKESNVATVGINFINRSPVALNNRLDVAAGAAASQYLFADDPDNDAVTFKLVNNPRFGKGEIKRDGAGQWRVFYQSLPNYAGPDLITFIAIDPQGKESAVAKVEINVIRVSGAGALQSGGATPSGGGS